MCSQLRTAAIMEWMLPAHRDPGLQGLSRLFQAGRGQGDRGKSGGRGRVRYERHVWHGMTWQTQFQIGWFERSSLHVMTCHSQRESSSLFRPLNHFCKWLTGLLIISSWRLALEANQVFSFGNPAFLPLVGWLLTAALCRADGNILEFYWD